MKNNIEHTIALSEQALAVLAEVPRIRSDRGLVFSTNGTSPSSGYSKAKAKIDSIMLRLAQAEAEAAGRDPAAVTIPHWTIHDIRRTVASGMARLGTRIEVVEKILNHVSGSFGGIVGVYQRHDFANEKRAALEAWGAHVERLVGDTGG